jgi:hypothetical protein
MGAHLKTCAPGHDAAKGQPTGLFQLRVEGGVSRMYWLDLEIKAEVDLRQLDDFLRRIWLECCGHLSCFHIGRFDYSVLLDDTFDVRPIDRTMDHRIGKVLSEGQRFSYEYDFGTTTELALHVRGERKGAIGREPLRLLARNEPPVWPCGECGKAAVVVCPFCSYEGDAFYCGKHAREHECSEQGEKAFLPVVNSPRMGMCGYTGS